MRTNDEEVRAALGRAIAEARGSRSQIWLAQQLGVHQTTVSDWERGRTAPTSNRLSQIESVLGMPPARLRRIAFGDDDQPADQSGEQQGVPAGLAGIWADLTEEERQRVLGFAEGVRQARRGE